MQEDLLVAELTVGELLNMAASLQLKEFSRTERKRRVKEAIQFLGLEDLIDRRIGTVEEGFLSGGQRRRVSLAIEGVLSSHKIIFLDEPTTGLSASDAAQMIELIQRLAKERGTTIVFSVHQPRAQVFLECVDKLLLLHAGRTVYFGGTRDVEKYFAAANCAFIKRAFTNPADLMIDKMADSKTTSKIMRYWPNSNEMKSLDNDIENYLPNESKENEEQNNQSKENFFTRIFQLFFRASYYSFYETMDLLQFGYRIFFRRKGFFVVAILFEFLYSILKGLLFSELENNIDYFGDRISSIFRSLEPGTSFVCLALYIDFLPLSNRDLLVGRYGVISYCIMWIAIAFFRSLFMTIANLIVYYWLSGLQRELSNFLIFFGISFLYKLSFTGMILMMSAISSDSFIGGTLIVVFETVSYFTCGYYVSRDVMWEGLRWMTYVSMFYYAYEGLSWTDVSQRTFSCDQEGCPIAGTDLLQSIGYEDRLSLDFSVIFLWTIVTFFIFCGYVIVFRVTMQLLRTHKFYTEQSLIDKDQCENNLPPQGIDLRISTILKGSTSHNNNNDDDDDEESSSDDEEIDDEEFILNYNRTYGNLSVIQKPNDQLEKNEKKKSNLKKPLSKSNSNSNTKSISFIDIEQAKDEEKPRANKNKDNKTPLQNSIQKIVKKIGKSSSGSFNNNNNGIHPSMSNILSFSQMKRQQTYLDHSGQVFNDALLENCKSNLSLPIAYFRLEKIRFEITKPKICFFPFIRDKESKITLLHDISAEFEPGSITAIMGNSGSGKSTLLHSICGYLNTNLSRNIYGNIYVENELVEKDCWPMNVVSFMGQFAENFIFPNYTIEESLLFAAQLQLPRSILYKEKKDLVENILRVLRLWEVKDNIIGPEGNRGVSGGQLRRISLAIEILLRRSKIYLLDEPTSGLSSSGAAEIVSILQSLAHLMKCTVVITIHQPRTEILEVFDKIIVLSKGFMIYNGTGNDIESYFERMGYPLAVNDCIADSMMDQIVADEDSLILTQSSNNKKKSKSKEETEEDLTLTSDDNNNNNPKVKSVEERILIKNFEGITSDQRDSYRDLPEIRKELRTPWYTPTWFQMLILAERRWILFERGVLGCSSLFILAAVSGILMTLFYLRIPNTAQNVPYIMGAAIVTCNFWLYMNTFSLFPYYEEKNRILYELAMHRYRPIASYSIHFLFCLTESVGCCLVFTSIVFWGMGLGVSIWSFTLFFLANAITGWIVLILQYFVIWYFKTIDQVTNVTSYFIFCLGMDFSGFICHIQHIPVYIRWISWISLQRYLAEIMYYGILVGRDFPCENGDPYFLVPTCPAPGIDFYLQYGYDLHPVLRDCLIVLGTNVIFFVAGYYICKSCVISWTIHTIRGKKDE